MKPVHATLLAALVTLISVGALAATAALVKDLPDGKSVTLTGTVEDFSSEHVFTLRDATGAVKIDLSAAKSVVLKDGEKVDVTGTVHHTLLGTDIVAQMVDENKDLGQQVGEAINSLTGETPDSNARSVTVQSLPDSGLVKVSGVVDSTDGAKKFTLKDSTGRVDVVIESGQAASLHKGTAVTVTGNVDKGLLRKSIKATDVYIQSSSP